MLYLCISEFCLSLSTVIIAHLSSNLLFLFIAQTVLSFTAVIDAHPSFILLFFCTAQAWLPFSTVIIGYPSSMLLFCAFHRSCCHSEVSLVCILAQPCFFCMHYAYLAPTVNCYNCVCELYFALFMHSTDLALRLESH